MRLSRELPAERFEALLADYRRLLREAWPGVDVEGEADTVWASFPAPADAARAAQRALRAVAAHGWPQGWHVSISVGVGPTVGGCEQLRRRRAARSSWTRRPPDCSRRRSSADRCSATGERCRRGGAGSRYGRTSSSCPNRASEPA